MKRARNIRSSSSSPKRSHDLAFTTRKKSNNKRKFGKNSQETNQKDKYNKMKPSFQLSNDEEISSDEDEELLSDADDDVDNENRNQRKKKKAAAVDDDEGESDHSDHETADEKRRRLSKMYLEKIRQLDEDKEDGAARKEDNDDDDDDDDGGDVMGDHADHNNWISEKLQQQRLMKKGKYFQDFSESFAKIAWEGLTVQSFNNGHHGAITCQQLSNNEQYILSGSKDNSVILWNTETKQKTFLQPKWNSSFDYSSHDKEVLAVAVSTDNRMMVSAGTDQKITVYDQRIKYSAVHTFEGHRGDVTGLAFQTDSYSLFSCSRDRCLKYWDLNQMGYVETVFGHQDDVLAVDCWHKLKPLSCSSDRTVRSWKIEQSSHLVFRGHKAPIDTVKILTEDSFVSASQDGSISLWKDYKKTPVNTVHAAHGAEGVNPRWVGSLATVKASNLIASGSSDGFVRLWSVKNDEISPLSKLPIDGYINSIAITPNLVVAASSREPRLGRWMNLKKCKNRISLVRLPSER